MSFVFVCIPFLLIKNSPFSGKLIVSRMNLAKLTNLPILIPVATHEIVDHDRGNMVDFSDYDVNIVSISFANDMV